MRHQTSNKKIREDIGSSPSDLQCSNFLCYPTKKLALVVIARGK